MRVGLASSTSALCILATAVLTGCSGGASQSSAPIAVAPAPTPSPSPSPTPTPTPTPTYSTLAALTGDQTYKTACAGKNNAAVPPAPLPATTFGGGFAFSYTASSSAYALSGNGLSFSFGPSQRDPAAPTSANTYIVTDVATGFVSRFTLGVPTAGGTALTYAGGFSLATNPNQYQCSYGVPTLATDLPAATYTYSKISLNGTIAKYDASMAPASLTNYRTTPSVVTLSINPVSKTISGTIVLTGNQILSGGTFGPDEAFGSYTITGTIDTANGSYYANIANSTGVVVGNLGGWFYGPQGIETLGSLSFTVNTSGGQIIGLANLAAIK